MCDCFRWCLLQEWTEDPPPPPPMTIAEPLMLHRWRWTGPSARLLTSLKDEGVRKWKQERMATVVMMMKMVLEERDCSSGDAVAARNGLWVTVRCRPCCAAAVKLWKRNPGCRAAARNWSAPWSEEAVPHVISCLAQIYPHVSPAGRPTVAARKYWS